MQGGSRSEHAGEAGGEKVKFSEAVNEIGELDPCKSCGRLVLAGYCCERARQDALRAMSAPEFVAMMKASRAKAIAEKAGRKAAKRERRRFRLAAKRVGKVLFLDFDGVANSLAYLQAHRTCDQHPCPEEHALDPIRIERLNRIIEATGASVVISSSWRYGRTVDQLAQLLVWRGFKGGVIDKTPDFCKTPDGKAVAASDRGEEIRQWLDAHPEVTEFVVLDDQADMTAVRDYFIQTEDGIEDEHVDRAIAMLGRRE